jgi:hypothetical protein
MRDACGRLIRTFGNGRLFGAVGFAAILAGILTIGFSPPAQALPSFARQTGQPCGTCHTDFPALTPYGRRFKLLGYTAGGGEFRTTLFSSQAGSDARAELDKLRGYAKAVNPPATDAGKEYVPPISLMAIVGYTHTQGPTVAPPTDPYKENDNVVLSPFSAFWGGAITENIGAFAQVTYSAPDPLSALSGTPADQFKHTWSWDNADVRYANTANIGGLDVVYGITANNNPTVQDAWNSTPTWQTPFDQKSSATPVPGAATQIDGMLAGRGVAGLTAYAWWKNSFFGEAGLYRSAPQGVGGTAGSGPLDSNSGGVLTDWAPYWRFAYEHQWHKNSLMVGAYGMTGKITPASIVGPPAFPAPVNGAADKFNDVALDTQYQFIGDEHIFSVQATYIKEKQNLDGSIALAQAAGNAAPNSSNDLKTYRVGGSWYYERTYGAALGYFSTSGSSDAAIYAPGAVIGFANGSPNSKGYIAELDYMPWQNVKILLQYIGYQKFNGASTNYDGNGRNASDNNTMYLLGWFAF